jgi:hypothetical protein
MLPVNNWALAVAGMAVAILRVPPLPALELSVMMPVAVERLLMVLLKPFKSRIAPAATLNALALLNPVALAALSVPELMVVFPV